MRNRNKLGQFKKGHKLWLGKKRPNISKKDNYNWKGGRIIQNGYKYILMPDHPKAKAKKGYIAEHVLVMEKKLGRHLKKGELVHHINENKLDNRLQNLKLFKNRLEHINFHAKERRKNARR